jgi:beta-lactamase regulating signal transducer with metallopeptidase domain/HEAT repeat protein
LFESALAPWGNGTLWIVGVAVKGAAVLLIVLLVAAVLRRASAGLRHLVWSGGILAVLLLPVVSLVLPWQLLVESVQVPALVLPADRAEAPIVRPAVAERDAADVESGLPSDERSVGTAISPNTVTEWLLVVWILGVLFLLGRLGVGAIHAQRVLRGAAPLDSPDWTHPLIEAADRLSVSRLPRLLTNDRVPMPVVCGIFKPAIVVPADACDWTDRRRRAVLCHELAHIRRLDLPANLLGRLACALHWFNPLVWLAARQLRAESERACDDFVLGVGTRPSEYADHLLQIVGGAKHARAPAVAIPMAQRREFEGRMLAILDRNVNREPASFGHLAGIATIAVLLLLPISAMTPTRAAPPTATEPPLDVDSQFESGTRPAGLMGALLEGLEVADASDRTAAANALGTLRERGAVGPLGDCLRADPDSNVRLTAAWALGQIASGDATESLSHAALKDTAVQVRGMAVWALGQIADPSTLTALEGALNDPSGAVRNRAIWAIGTIGPNKASPTLLSMLHDSEDDVREIAAWAIGQTGDPAAVRPLVFALGDPFPKTGIAALWSLAHIGGPDVRQPLRDAMDGPYVDSKLRDAIERAITGLPVEPQSRSWPIPAIR